MSCLEQNGHFKMSKITPAICFLFQHTRFSLKFAQTLAFELKVVSLYQTLGQAFVPDGNISRLNLNLGANQSSKQASLSCQCHQKLMPITRGWLKHQRFIICSLRNRHPAPKSDFFSARVSGRSIEINF